ncbi:MAG: hypothetical protein L0Z55_04475 [Planctomycetes bacterium]|nr:hypothetical protein [Planctomycetota bacterium]
MKRGYVLGLLSGLLLAALPVLGTAILWMGGVDAQTKKNPYQENVGGEIPNGYGVLKGVAGTKDQLALVFEDESTKSIFIMEFNGAKLGNQVKKLTRSSN